nr:hypothetical protein GCM10025730_07220 [Promicromonospora thailandica]
MTDIDAANVEWGDLDEEILALAPVVPLMVARTVSLPGENVTGLHASANAATGGIDYVGVGLKDPEKG